MLQAPYYEGYIYGRRDSGLIQRTDLILSGEWYRQESSKLYPMRFTNWGPGQPDYYRGKYRPEACLNLWHNKDFRWNDASCKKKLCFICQL